MKIERSRNAIRGTLFGIVLRFVQIVFPFVIRTIFIKELGIEYLGLNSLFTSILQVLNLAELGVSSALVFSMYRPISEDDKKKICQLMNLYRSYYRIIGFIILFIGLLIIPFLPLLIKGDIPADINLYVLYGMHLSTTVLSYWLFAYRNSLLLAHQRNDIINIVRVLVLLVFYFLQIIVLVIFRNYYAYLSLSVLEQIGNNILTAFVTKKVFPNYKPYGSVSKAEKEAISHQVRYLFTAKIGGVVNHSADSIVASAYLGLELLAIYQNYYYIISAIMALFGIFFASCTAGIGNSLITQSDEKNRELFYRINHIVFCGLALCCTVFISACQPFIEIWVGSDYKLGYSFVFLFALYLFAEEAPRTLIVFKDAGGIWKHDRYRPLASACVNLSLNLILTPIIGLYGIIASTIFSMLCVSFPWAIINTHRRLFKIDIMHFLRRTILYFLAICLSCGIVYFINLHFTIRSGVIEMLFRIALGAIISLTVYMVFFFKTEENKYVIKYIKKHLKRMQQK